MLTNKIIDAAKPAEKPYKLADSDGLYLFVSATGVKSWRYNYKEKDKQKTKTYGRYPLLGISDVRKLHHTFKYSLDNNDGMTFKQVAEAWMRVHLPTLRNIKHQKQIADTLEQFVYPVVGDNVVQSIKRRSLVDIAQAIEARGTIETAHRVAGRIKQVFDYAIDLGEIEGNPAVGLARVLSKPKRVHMTALPLVEVPQLMRDILNYSETVTRIGLQLLAHTFVRTRELTLARWSEVDFDNCVWVIPNERMKLNRPHVVPLSTQVMGLLEDLAAITLSSGYVLESPAQRGKPMSENGLLFALYRLGYRGRMTGHGFRAVASSALNESGLWLPAAIERQLAHKETDEVRAAYHRAEYLEERVRMMQWWSDKLTSFTQ